MQSFGGCLNVWPLPKWRATVRAMLPARAKKKVQGPLPLMQARCTPRPAIKVEGMQVQGGRLRCLQVQAGWSKTEGPVGNVSAALHFRPRTPSGQSLPCAGLS